ncbi:MAG TPA: HPr family phosphocarrier protein [Kiloniellaceae bacterium]
MTGKLDSPASEAAAPSSARRTVTVSNQKGLHARAAAKFVKLAEQFDAQVTVEKSDTRVPGCSIMGLMMLAAGPGCDIDIEASGPQARQAVDALAQLVAGKFDEDG